MSKLCNCPRWLIRAGIVVLILGAVLGYVGWERFFRDYGQPAFATPDERFKYGSFGQELTLAFPTGSSTSCLASFPTNCPGRAATRRSAWPGNKAMNCPSASPSAA